MTDQPIEQATPEEQEILSEAAASPTVHRTRERIEADDQDDEPNDDEDEDEDEEPEGLEDIDLTNCDINFLINIRGVGSLLEAVDIAAANLGRYGMDSFYILATDPDTGRQWVLSNGEIQEADKVIERLEELKADDSD